MKFKFAIDIELELEEKDAKEANEIIEKVGEEEFIEVMQEEMKKEIVTALGYKATDGTCRVAVKSSVEQLTKESE